MPTHEFLHIALACKDPIKIERFYTKHFGFERSRVYVPGPGQVVMIKAGNVAFEIFEAKEVAPYPQHVQDGPWWPGFRHIAFRVDDLDAKLAELDGIAPLTHGPIDFGAFVPGMRTAWVADPEGNIIELNQGYVDEENPPPLPPEETTAPSAPLIIP